MEAKELIETMENLRVKLQLFMEETKHNLLDELYPKPYIDVLLEGQPSDEKLVFPVKERDFPRFLEIWNTLKSEKISAEIHH